LEQGVDVGADLLVVASVQARLAVPVCLNLQEAQELLPVLLMVAGRQLGECNRTRAHQHGNKLVVAVEHLLKRTTVVGHPHGAERMMGAVLHTAVTMEVERRMAAEPSMVEVEGYGLLSLQLLMSANFHIVMEC
jgi:hypothetical protein